MKIAHLYLHALGPGGYPRDVRWLVGALAKASNSVALVTLNGDDTDGLTGDDIEIVEPARFTSICRNVDLVHVWGMLVPQQIAMSRSARRAGCDARFVISPLAQLMPLHMGQSRWKKLPYFTVLQATFRHLFDAAHFFSQEEYWASVRYLKPRLSFEATLGVFPTERPPSDGAEGDYLLFFGRNDVRQKGLDLMAEGYRLALRDGLDLPLLVAGRTHADSDRFWGGIRDDPEFRGLLRMLGEIPDQERRRLLAHARCLVFPSRWDGPPRPIREAIALGTPAVVTHGTNMGQLIEDHEAGELVALEAESIKRALTNAADISTVEHWRKGAKQLSDSLQWDKVALEYLTGYESALSSA